MKKPKTPIKKTVLLAALAAFLPAAAGGGVILSDNFDGTEANLNNATPDVGATNWVAASCFDQNGDVNITAAGAGSATLAFTPVDGLIYTLEASVSLSTGGSGDFIGFGFANGQSTVSTTSHRFLDGNVPEGRAWLFARENTNNPRVCLTGATNAVAWAGFTQSPSNLDLRIVLDTTGGAGNWKATWFAKDATETAYTEIGAETALADEDINSVGFSVANSGVTASITNFTLSDNQAPSPPVIVSITPADDAVGVAPDTDLVATFDRPIQLTGSGDFTIRNLTASTDTVISLPGPDPDGALTVEGKQLTINPSADLGSPGDEIVIEISAGALESDESAAFAGLQETDDPNWSFTIDNIPPTPVYFHPIPSSDKAPLDGALFIAFDEAPTVGSGNLSIYQADDTLVETIDITSANVTVNGTRITINPTVQLSYGTSYYVLIDDTAFADSLGNGYGITDPATWTFTTISDDPGVLFGDSFNRPGDADLNEPAAKYGSLGPLTYTPVLVGVANVQLSDGQLLLESNEGNGNSGAVVYPEHNFVDPAISTGGGFSVSVDLNAYVSGGTTRYLAVAVGQTDVDIDAQTSASITGSAGDLVVGYRGTNSTLVIKENGGSDIIIPDLPETPTTMRIEYSLSDFNSGSTVEYRVFFDAAETAFTSGTFTWSGTGENYVSLSSNLLITSEPGERHALFDNLQIRSLGTSAPVDFAAWQNTNGTAGGFDEDHDGDGVRNGVEYFLFGSANSTGFTTVPTVTDNGGVRSISWTKAASGYSGVYGTDFVVETSDSLEVESWEPATVSATPGTPDTVHIDGDTVTYTFGTGTKDFVRLKVTGP